MILLPKAVSAWNTPEFRAVLKSEIARLGADRLPLQQGLSATSYALDDAIEVLVLHASEEAGCIHAKVGIFYSGIVAGCSCADDPTPIEPQNEYCELLFAIDKRTAHASVTLLRD